MSKYFWLCLCIGILICDIALKAYCRQYPHDTYINGLHIVYNQKDIPLIVIVIVALCATLMGAIHLNLRWNIIYLGGLWSNVIELLIFGNVTDMIDFYYIIPNIADFMITAGIIKSIWVYRNMQYQQNILNI